MNFRPRHSRLSRDVLLLSVGLLSCGGSSFGRVTRRTDTNIQKDTFTQKTAESVDIVFVVDSSGSMNEEQINLAENAALLTDILTGNHPDLPEASVDFRMMIITTDASFRANPSGPPSYSMLMPRCGEESAVGVTGEEHGWITPENFNVPHPDFPNEFMLERCLKVGVAGSGLEEGLEASRRSLDPEFDPIPNDGIEPDAGDGGLNPDFLRKDADLHIVFLSDEQDDPDRTRWGQELGTDHPDYLKLVEEVKEGNEDIFDQMDGQGQFSDIYFGAYGYTPLVGNHAERFEDIKGDGNAVGHAIVLPRLEAEGCRIRNNQEEVGSRYHLFAEVTGGLKADLCGDWSETVSEIGLQASGLKKCFKLSQIPGDFSSIKVKENGEETSKPWEYKVLSNSVCFEDFPASGAEIVVSYKKQ